MHHHHHQNCNQYFPSSQDGQLTHCNASPPFLDSPASSSSSSSPSSSSSSILGVGAGAGVVAAGGSSGVVWDDLEILTYHIQSVVISRYAVTTVTCKIRNPTLDPQEAAFSFLLPVNAFISNLTM